MKLPSGAILEVTMSDFATSKALYQVISKELKGVKFESADRVEQMFKDIFCVAISSVEIEKAVWECMKRATYDGIKITPDTFESEKAREDYLEVLFEVTRVNTLPFMKNLYAKFSPLLEKMGIILP